MLKPSPDQDDTPPLAAQARILSGVRVLDLSRFLSGPQTTLFLAALGAEVIRIDDPAKGDPTFDAPPYLGAAGVSFTRAAPEDVGIAYLKRSRGKKSASLDLKSKEGRELFLRLVEKADVVVENFRVGVTERLGITYETLKARNPRIIHCAITGYGSTGPERHRKAFDLMVQAASGFMSITGAPDGAPSKTGSPLSDGIAGTFAFASVLGALYQRERTGAGQFIDVSMTDCLVSLMFDEPFDCYGTLGLPLRQGNRITRFSPFNTYPTRDGMVAIGAGTEEDWRALLAVMGRDDLLQCPDHMSRGWRIANNDRVDALVRAWTEARDTAEAVAALDAREIPCGPIRRIDEVASWPHMVARRMLEPLVNPLAPQAGGAVAPAFPVKFSQAETSYTEQAPLPRFHNGEVFADILGLPPEELARLSQAGVI